MYKIFIVEDDPVICRAVSEHLALWGYQVRSVRDFSRVIEEFTDFNPHLVLLDIGLPVHNGYYYCQELRKRSKAPVVFLSSASDNINIVTAIELGGDDFIAKPFDLTVLTAKIQAVLRRAYDMAGKIPLLEYRGAILNLNSASLTYQGEQVELTKNEFRILQTLLENKGKVVSRDTLMTKLWQMDSYVEENTLTVNVARLRKKLENAGLANFITTRVGSGYIVL